MIKTLAWSHIATGEGSSPTLALHPTPLSRPALGSLQVTSFSIFLLGLDLGPHLLGRERVCEVCSHDVLIFLSLSGRP